MTPVRDAEQGRAKRGRLWPRGPSRFAARVFWSIIPIVTVLLIVMGLISFYQNRALLEEEFMKRGQEMANSLAYGSELGVLSEDPQLLESSLRAVVGDTDVAYVFLYREDGQLLFHWERWLPDVPAGGASELGVRKLIQLVQGSKSLRPLQDGIAEFRAAIVSEGANTPDELLLGLTPIGEAGVPRIGPRAIGWVELGLSQVALQQSGARILQLWGGLTVAFVALSTLVIYGFSRRITRPIDRLTDHALRIADGDLDQEIPVDSRDEIGQLAASFNEMAGALKQNIGEKERLLAELQNLNRTL